MKMKIFILNLFLIFFVGNLVEAYDGGMLSAGYAHTCAIDFEGVKCWGNNEHGKINVPPLKNPVSITAGYEHTCAIDDDGMKCWGNNENDLTNIPSLKDPTSVSAGEAGYTCAIDDERVRCWGNNYEAVVKIPPLKNPIAVSAGASQTCAIDEEGVKCWDRDSETKVPSLKNPTFLSVGYSRTCAIDDRGLKCWANDDGDLLEGIPILKNPTSVSAGQAHTCAIDGEGVKCWGFNGNGQTDVPPLKNPTFVSAGTGHTCAIDDEGVKCWGDNYDGQTNVPPLMYFWQLNRLDLLIDRLASLGSPIRTYFFNSLKPFVDDTLKLNGTSPDLEQLVHGQYIFTALLKASIETGDSSVYTNRIIPEYIASMKKISEQTGIHGLDQVKDLPLTRLTALKVMQSSLFTMTEFLTAEDKTHVQDIIKLIGLAMSDVSSTQNTTNVIMAIDVNEAIIDKLSNSSKTRFLVLTLNTAQQWLKAKTQ